MTAGPVMLTVFDTQSDTAGTVALADVAADIRRYEVPGPAAAGDSPAPGGAR